MQHQLGWVLKGGSNIYCRVPGARHTKDLDLYRRYEPTSSIGAAEAMVDTMDGHRAGPYTFRVIRPERTSAVGTVDSERVKVRVIHGVNSEHCTFYVDVSGDLEVTGAVEHLEVPSSYQVETEFLPRSFRVFSYPVASQVADKICAMYERHGERPPGSASTRYHDLYDVALIALELTVTAEELRDALVAQCRVRDLTLPTSLELPDDSWMVMYPATARNFGGKYRELEDLDEALRVAGLLVNPVLSGDAEVSGCSWDHTALRWLE
ncbi:MAG TPA: nucleotidyl transferase AbiEii/AbiGii toxin family protein [Candidatus Corynebacterium avicola]|uniref:Nucleotidyl transferase AbiEii/AbiGii toxin family protein n=1 Tax=Candidatus Corynebacterium avicola TaxID=2838527 RepID=A0A9D1RM11_9CORY|nr:nucleotidyl transferase AbiEii/AbiGii toxin family protein [Candidatus Corynebacterium avicola]